MWGLYVLRQSLGGFLEVGRHLATITNNDTGQCLRSRKLATKEYVLPYSWGSNNGNGTLLYLESLSPATWYEIAA